MAEGNLALLIKASLYPLLASVLNHMRLYITAWQNFLLPRSLNKARVSTHLTNYSQNWSMSMLSMQSLLLTWLICTVNFPQVLATVTFCSPPWLSSPVSYVLDMDRLSVVHIFPFCICLKAIYLFCLPLGIDVVIWMLSLIVEPTWSSASVFLGAGLLKILWCLCWKALVDLRLQSSLANKHSFIQLFRSFIGWGDE